MTESHGDPDVACAGHDTAAGPNPQSILVRLAQMLADWDSLDELVSALMRLVLDVGGHERASVFLWDENNRCATVIGSAGTSPIPIDAHFDYEGMSPGVREAIDTRRTAVIDYDAAADEEVETARKFGLRLALFAPMQRRGTLVGALLVDDPGHRKEFSSAQIETVESVASHAATGVQNAKLVAELERSLQALTEKDRAIRQAYSDVIDAVTGGRLIIVGRDELDETLLGTTETTFELGDARDLAAARPQLAAIAGHLPRLEELQLAVCEGLANMLKHAGGGEWWVLQDETRVQVVLSDSGPGIDFRQLPKATLVPGYSMAQSLGMGFTLMMELADRILVCTDPGGTTLVLEMDVGEPSKAPRDIGEVLDRGCQEG